MASSDVLIGFRVLDLKIKWGLEGLEQGFPSAHGPPDTCSSLEMW